MTVWWCWSKKVGQALNTQQPGIKKLEMSSSPNRPSPEGAAVKAETGWSVWPATA